MVDNKAGARRQADQALVATPSSPLAVSTEGFDPSRFRPNSYEGKPRHMGKAERREMDALLRAAREHIDKLPPRRLATLLKAFLEVSQINCSWQHFALAETFIWQVGELASAIEARSDATGTGAAEGESAVAKPDAQPSGPPSGDPQ